MRQSPPCRRRPQHDPRRDRASPRVGARLPAAPQRTNGKKVALLGAGCASLAVANDLLPIGYEITIFEALETTGGLMRTNIPQFRLPPEVLDEEIDYILDMGINTTFDIEVDSRDPKEVIQFCKLIEPTFGGINLEDIKAPECFEVEARLRERMNIPVFHDDQHGTAIIVGAAIYNGLRLVGKDPSEVKLVTSGAGAAALDAYDAERRPKTAAVVLANRGDGPDKVLDIVEERAPGEGMPAKPAITARRAVERAPPPTRTRRPSSVVCARSASSASRS